MRSDEPTDPAEPESPRQGALRSPVFRVALRVLCGGSLCIVAALLVARTTGTAAYGLVLGLGLASVAMRLWLGRLPASMRSGTLVRPSRLRATGHSRSARKDAGND